MLDIQAGDIATWLASIVAIISAATAYKSSKAADQHQAEAAENEKRSADLLEKKHQLELRVWTEQYFNAVREWGEQVCYAMVEATHIVELGQKNKELRTSVLNRLSTLIDTGRWYFPNQWVDDYGTHKQAAYRGIRQPILDTIVVVYDEIKSESVTPETQKKIIAAKREFVSYIQTILDPNLRENEIKKVLCEFEESKRLREAK